VESGLLTSGEEQFVLVVHGDTSSSVSHRLIDIEFRVFQKTPIRRVRINTTEWPSRHPRRTSPPLPAPRSLYYSFSLRLCSFSSFFHTSSPKHGRGDINQSGCTRRIGNTSWYHSSPGFSLTQTRPLNLTEAELAQYDGTDPNKPIYLAIEYSLPHVGFSPVVETCMMFPLIDECTDLAEAMDSLRAKMLRELL